MKQTIVKIDDFRFIISYLFLIALNALLGHEPHLINKN
jgi:hypothetical protein